MEFTNVTFLCFFIPAFFAIYVFIPPQLKNLFILIFSFLVLFLNAPVLFFLMVFLAGFNYFFSRLFFNITFSSKFRLVCYYSLVGLNLVLFYFCLTFVARLALIFSVEVLVDEIFKALFFMANISYILDLCSKRCEVQSRILDYFLYIFMFPKIVLGPAVCYYKFERQLKKREESLLKFTSGLEIFIIGFSKKVILAAEMFEIKKFVDYQTPDNVSVVVAFVGACANFLYVYFTISGYSDMATGFGKTLGFEFPENFKTLSFADSLEEFFSRWNISVINFLKAYIFPWVKDVRFKGFFRVFKICAVSFFYVCFLGGKRTYFLIAIYFLIIMVVERMLYVKFEVKIPKKARQVLTFIFILFGAAMFRQNSVEVGLKHVYAMVGSSGILLDKSVLFLNVFFRFVLFILLYFLGSVAFKNLEKLKNKHETIYGVLKYGSLVVLLALSMVFCISC